MSASINDKITQSENGGAPEPTTVSSARSISGTSLSCVALTNWPTDTAVHLITYKKKTDGSIDRSSLCLWKGIVSSTTIGSLTLKGGTDAGNDVGDFVEMAPTSALWQDLYDGLTQTLNIDGTLKTGIVTSTKIASSAVTTNALNDSAVTPDKWANPYAFKVYRNAAFNFHGATWGATQFDTKSYDISSNVDVVTNKGRFTTPVSGRIWHFDANLDGVFNDTNVAGIRLYKNGVFAAEGTIGGNGGGSTLAAHVSADLKLDANDYVEVYDYSSGGQAGNPGEASCYFNGHLAA